MMFVASYKNTMANARQIVPDTGFAARIPLRRARLIALSRKWSEKQEAEQRRKQEKLERIEAEMAAWRAHQAKLRAEQQSLKPGEIIAMVATWHGITVDDLLGKSRVKSLVAARYDAIAAVYLNCRIQDRAYTTPELGRVFSRDHSTILHGLSKRGIKVARAPGYMPKDNTDFRGA